MLMDESTAFDAVIPFHSKDAAILPYCIMSLRNYAVGLQTIYVISKDDPEEDCVWIPEESFSFSIESVSEVIHSTNGRQGWYYQQLLKLYVFRDIPGIRSHVLWFDSDLVLCRPIRFFQDGKTLLDWSEPQGHAAYFEHGEKVLGDSFCQMTPDKCGIADHMMVSRPILEAMLMKIETRAEKPAWIALLEAVDPKDWDFSGMSEYELYYNHALMWYAESHALRHLEKGRGTSFRALTEGSQSADMIAFHAWLTTLHNSQIESSRTGVTA